MAVLDNSGTQSQWHESTETFNVIIDKQLFDKGRTKKVFKVGSSLIVHVLFSLMICAAMLHQLEHYLRS